MIVALTGTPGTGKSSVAKKLEEKGFITIDLHLLAIHKGFISGKDKRRNSVIIDVERIDEFIKKNYLSSEIIILDSHLSHLLQAIEKVIIFRCHPKQLFFRLQRKGWSQKKINENVEAEILDVILSEAVQIHSIENIFEIDTTDKTINHVVDDVSELISKNFFPLKQFKVGLIDWSEEILERFP